MILNASNHILSEAGPVARRRSAVPVSAPAREGAAQPTPRAPSCPRSFPAEDQVATLALPHAFLFGTSRLLLSVSLRGLGPRMACRRRALETV